MFNDHYYFGTFLTLFVYIGVLRLKKGRRLFFYNSVLYSTLILIGVLVLLKIDYEHYQVSTKPISDLLAPLVVLLAIPLYGYKHLLKEHFAYILLGIGISGASSVTTVILLANLFNMDQQLMFTLIPKSITTPMAISMSTMLDGIVGITVVAVIITGILGASIMGYLIQLFHLESPIAIGVALGSTSHGIGTSKAIELGPDVGAISGLAMGLTGVLFILTTSVLLLFMG